MTNEQKYFTYKNPYDLLIAMHKRAGCALLLLGVDLLPCLSDKHESPITCDECLQRWLREEAK